MPLYQIGSNGHQRLRPVDTVRPRRGPHSRLHFYTSFHCVVLHSLSSIVTENSEIGHVALERDVEVVEIACGRSKRSDSQKAVLKDLRMAGAVGLGSGNRRTDAGFVSFLPDRSFPERSSAPAIGGETYVRRPTRVSVAQTPDAVILCHGERIRAA